MATIKKKKKTFAEMSQSLADMCRPLDCELNSVETHGVITVKPLNRKWAYCGKNVLTLAVYPSTLRYMLQGSVAEVGHAGGVIESRKFSSSDDLLYVVANILFSFLQQVEQCQK